MSLFSRNRVASGRPSRTAMAVAYWRAAADAGITTIPDFSDPYAAKLLDGFFWKQMVGRLDHSAKNPVRRAQLVQAVDALVSRVAFLDQQVAKAAHPQVVILGAGLDTRAWRLPALRNARTFEVDHPSTQTYKRAHADVLGEPLGELVWAPVDFGTDDLGQRLVEAGHRADQPTTWIWEGVVMYLDDAAVEATLAQIRRRSAPGSTLLLHYHTPETTERLNIGRRVMFTLIGEPQIGLRSAAATRTMVEQAGFLVVDDAGIAEQAAAIGAQESRFPLARVSRIIVATA